jgi:hypothetical protein
MEGCRSRPARQPEKDWAGIGAGEIRLCWSGELRECCASLPFVHFVCAILQMARPHFVRSRRGAALRWLSGGGPHQRDGSEERCWSAGYVPAAATLFRIFGRYSRLLGFIALYAE